MTPSARSCTVLVLNAGSSSVKFALVDSGSGDRVLDGLVERVGTDETSMTSTGPHGTTRTEVEGTDHRGAVRTVLTEVTALEQHLHPVAVGHRIVHGGERYRDSVVVTDEVLEAIRAVRPLAPLHNPPGIRGIKAVTAAWPDLPQVAVFDTAFHQSMPPRAYRYAVPADWYTRLGVRRYGFHGTSHRYVSGRAAELLGREVAGLAMVVAHLGNGCSATAVLDGSSVDTTMGLTPLEGLVMGTRSGDIDPGMFGYLDDEHGVSAHAVTTTLNGDSGLLGLSGLSRDMRELTLAREAGHEGARLAIDVFVYRLAKAVAGLVVGLGRLDALVFTGGIGENSAEIRAMTVEALGFLGLRVDEERNREHGRESGGRVGRGAGPEVLVVPTDEELMIAMDTIRLTAPTSEGS